MRSLEVISRYLCIVQGLLLATLLSTSAMQCASEKETDAQRDGLSGPVKSISKTEHLTQVKLDEPDERSVLFWSSCAECEYDKDGNRTIQNSTAKQPTTFEMLAVP
jgi:hypothetical protein